MTFAARAWYKCYAPGRTDRRPRYSPFGHGSTDSSRRAGLAPGEGFVSEPKHRSCEVPTTSVCSLTKTDSFILFLAAHPLVPALASWRTEFLKFLDRDHADTAPIQVLDQESAFTCRHHME